jgi:hypothetical protein
MPLQNIGGITATFNSFNAAFFSLEGMRRRLRLGVEEKFIVIRVSPKVVVDNQEHHGPLSSFVR